MARTAVTPTAWTKDSANAVVLSTAGVAIDATNHHSITPPAGYAVDDMLLFVENTTNATKAATVKAGDNPPAAGAGAGDLSVSLTDGSTTTTQAFVPLTSGRFMQDDGTVYVDIASGMTGRIAAFYRTK